VRRLMTKMGLSPIYQRPRTSAPHPQHRILPVSAAALLRHLAIERPNQVWCAGSEAERRRSRRTHHLYPDAAWLAVPRRHRGLGNAQGAGMASVEHYAKEPGGRRLSHHGVGGSADALWHPRHLQHGPRAASSAALPSPPCSRPPISGSAWTVAGAGWTVSLIEHLTLK